MRSSAVKQNKAAVRVNNGNFPKPGKKKINLFLGKSTYLYMTDENISGSLTFMDFQARNKWDF